MIVQLGIEDLQAFIQQLRRLAWCTGRTGELTLRPLCTPAKVGWTYKGQLVSMNVEKHAKASSWVGSVYRNGAERTFIPSSHTS